MRDYYVNGDFVVFKDLPEVFHADGPAVSVDVVDDLEPLVKNRLLVLLVELGLQVEQLPVKPGVSIMKLFVTFFR
jgi:hypothetical protein